MLSHRLSLEYRNFTEIVHIYRKQFSFIGKAIGFTYSSPNPKKTQMVSFPPLSLSIEDIIIQKVFRVIDGSCNPSPSDLRLLGIRFGGRVPEKRATAVEERGGGCRRSDKPMSVVELGFVVVWGGGGNRWWVGGRRQRGAGRRRRMRGE
jgi:hypothetical protein